MSDQIEGRNPVREALRSGRPIRRLLVAEGAGGGPVAEIVRVARLAGVRVDRTRALLRRLPRLRERGEDGRFTLPVMPTPTRTQIAIATSTCANSFPCLTLRCTSQETAL